MAAQAGAKVGKKLGRVIHFANLPLKMLLPSSRENIKEVAFRTIPSASKVEIKRVLESLYGLEVEKVHTLNMEGKKKLNRHTGKFYRRPDYKKAYVVLKNPVSLPADAFPMNAFKDADADEDEDENSEIKLTPRLYHGVKSPKRK